MSSKINPLEAVKCLKVDLEKLKPQHDTPIGLIHPYWARKPLNIVDTIISRLSNKNDFVFDPFSGSGTIPFSALSNGRNAIASDLNPLSIFITQNVLELGTLGDKELEFIKGFFQKLSNKYSDWFLINDEMIERIRYEVSGEYKDGNFTLLPVEVVTKKKIKSGWRGRNAQAVKTLKKNSGIQKYKHNPIDFRTLVLPENSRIAIPKGAVLYHFFDEMNIAVINFLYSHILEVEPLKMRNALLFILSSSLPLLRISDKKATSQWPYWRPKSNVTSRNPLFIIEKRVESFCEGAIWARNKTAGTKNVAITKLYNKEKQPIFSVFRSAAQQIRSKGIKSGSIDLILTDPPYADQAPYLEYSELWNNILFSKSGNPHYSQEIVKTDAPQRKKDNSEYIHRLTAALSACCDCLKTGGFFAFFYQDRSLFHWTEISKALANSDMAVVEVLSLPKQRRSLKTVTSPGRTLDGDLLVIARKSRAKKSSEPHEKDIMLPKNQKTLFAKYSFLIREGLMNESMDRLMAKDPDVFSLIEKLS